MADTNPPPFNPKELMRERKFSLSNPPMPWFGIDIGGTLSKLVYFEPTDHSDWPEGSLEEERDTVNRIHKYLVGNTAYGDTGIRDVHVELPNAQINCRLGTIHFIRFPTSQMAAFMSLAQRKGLASLSSTVCATGGGAHKFEKIVNQELNLQLHKFDELESLIHGMEFVLANNAEECYYWSNPLNDSDCRKQTWTSDNGTRCVPYPYLVVNIGSGVSILSVRGPRRFERVSGSSLGGGLFHGLCCLLTGCETFEEALDLAAKGDNTKVDKLVKDIYGWCSLPLHDPIDLNIGFPGGDYSLFGLPGDTVAASFAQVIDKEKRAVASKEDLARAALVSVTNNIAAIARLCAKSEGIGRVVFVGNFLRANPIASRRLAFGMEYWSQGLMKALFMQHEGYFGAIGCLLELMRMSERRRFDKQNGLTPPQGSGLCPGDLIGPEPPSTAKTGPATHDPADPPVDP